MRTLLVDGDVFIYASASSNQYPIEWDCDTWTLHGDFGKAKAQFDDTISDLKEKLEATHVVMALTDYNDPWRKKVLPTYKSNRTGMKPILLKPLREYVHEKYETFQRPGLEGDDCLGILLTVAQPPDNVKGERVVVSIDKDMKTLPGKHFDVNRDEAMREVSLEEADRYHMLQTLTGDTTDGYKGCPGVGPVSAEKVLAGLKTVAEMWPAVVKTYEKKGLSEEVALTMARVARICRAEDYDFKKREVRLWQPKT